jgi:tRNA 5-methylaminomethyl-2-thiouridine biosynthesis bifunctional protein
MLSFDADQHPRSDLYQDVYKSRAGAISEAKQVFVEGAGLPELFGSTRQCTVLELGFGLGVNFLATLAAWREFADAGTRLHFVSIERHPLDADEITRAHAALGLDDADSRALRECWPLTSPGMQRLSFADGLVSLIVAHGDLLSMLPRLRMRADAIFLDGFAPDRNPQMWSLPAMKAIGRLAAKNARLATYSSAQLVRQNLSAAGFVVSLKPGYAGKRRRIEAQYAPRWRHEPQIYPPQQAQERRALIIGAGIAGCAISERLARAGWKVTLLEQSGVIGGQAANQPAIADHLHVSPDDNPTARLTRAALLLERQLDWPSVRRCGRLQMAPTSEQAIADQACVDKLAFPQQLLQFADRANAVKLSGSSLVHAGMWMPTCRIADPGRLCAQWLAAAADRVELRTSMRVERVRQDAGRWQALDVNGQLLASAPVLILASAAEALRLAGLPLGMLRKVRSVLGGDAYACPLDDGDILIGSTFDEDEDPMPHPQSDLSNLRRLARMIGPLHGAEDFPDEALSQRLGPSQSTSAGDLHCLDASRLQDQADALAEQFHRHARSGAVGFRYTSRDRLPLIGQLPDLERIRADAGLLSRNAKLPIPVRAGLYGAFGFGSRGLLWSRLAAETIAAMLDNEPMPLESDLLDAIDPARFLRHALRRSQRLTGNR